MAKCMWQINENPCEGEVIVFDLCPGIELENEYEFGHSMHAMPICRAHLNDHICLFKGCIANGSKMLDGNYTREKLQQFDKKLS